MALYVGAWGRRFHERQLCAFFASPSDADFNDFSSAAEAAERPNGYIVKSAEPAVGGLPRPPQRTPHAPPITLALALSPPRCPHLLSHAPPTPAHALLAPVSPGRTTARAQATPLPLQCITSPSPAAPLALLALMNQHASRTTAHLGRTARKTRCHDVLATALLHLHRRFELPRTFSHRQSTALTC